MNSNLSKFESEKVISDVVSDEENGDIVVDDADGAQEEALEVSTVEEVEEEEQHLSEQADDDDDVKSQAQTNGEDKTWDEWNVVGRMEYSDFPPVVSATTLEIGIKYPIVAFRRIRADAVRFYLIFLRKKNENNFSLSLSLHHTNKVLLQSQDFSIFLPKRLTTKSLPFNVAGRFFVITGFKVCFGSVTTPLIQFVTME